MWLVILLMLGQTTVIYDHNTWTQTTVIKTGRSLNVWTYDSFKMVFPERYKHQTQDLFGGSNGYVWERQTNRDPWRDTGLMDRGLIGNSYYRLDKHREPASYYRPIATYDDLGLYDWDLDPGLDGSEEE